jgi:N-formylglutamate deformylase
MTDWYTDELSDIGAEASRLIFPVSRLVCDPERFADDAREPMAAKGMGAVYTKTSDGRPLRASLQPDERQRILDVYYYPHQREIERLVRSALADCGRCLIIDAHSFPSSPLPCDMDQSQDRPDICIGTDAFHTPAWLWQAALGAFSDLGYRVELDRPYAGTIVPGAFHRRDARVHSIMVEVNRSLYMNEGTGERSAGFDTVRLKVQSVLDVLIGSSGPS